MSDTTSRVGNPYTVKPVGENVLIVRFEDIKGGWDQWLLLTADRHHDSLYCRRDIERKQLARAKERGALIIDCGDLFCAMQGKYDPRSNMDDIRPEDVGQDYLDRIVKHAAKDYAPYVGNWLMLGRGNHETNIRKRHGTDLIVQLANKMNYEHNGNVYVGGYGGWVRFVFVMNRTKRKSINLKYHHGAGGGGPVTKGVIQTNRQAVYLPDADIVVNGHCFDDKTEILTPGGWKKHTGLDNSSVVMTYNRKKDELEWQMVKNVYRYTDYKELISVSARGLDLCVTPDHGLWLMKGRRTATHNRVNWKSPDANWGSEKAKDAFAKERTFRLAAHEYNDDLSLTIPQVRLLAWIIAEGHVSDNKRKDGDVGCIRISQSDLPDGRLSVLEKDLTEAGVEFTKKVRNIDRSFTAYRYWIRKANIVWHEWIGKYITKDKTPTALLYNMSHEQREQFIDAYVMADGSRDSRGHPSFQIASKRKDHIDFLQSLLVRNGYRSSISHNNDMYYLAITNKETVIVGKDNWERTEYDGTVWCVSVPNETLLVRRNGKTSITMNTHDAWYVPIERERLSMGGKVFLEPMHFIRTPGYKDEYDTGAKGFHNETWRPPKPVGCAWVHFIYNATHSTIDTEIMVTVV